MVLPLLMLKLKLVGKAFIRQGESNVLISDRGDRLIINTISLCVVKRWDANKCSSPNEIHWQMILYTLFRTS